MPEPNTDRSSRISTGSIATIQIDRKQLPDRLAAVDRKLRLICVMGTFTLGGKRRYVLHTLWKRSRAAGEVLQQMRSGNCRIPNGCSTSCSDKAAGYEHAHQHPRLAPDREWSTDRDWVVVRPFYWSDLQAWAISNASGYAPGDAAFHRVDLQHDRVVSCSPRSRDSCGRSRASSISR